MIALIDADSIVHICAWHHRLMRSEDGDALDASVDTTINNILLTAGATGYYGVLSCRTSECFRTERYKYAPYKGSREEKPDWFQQWAPLIKYRMREQWGFFHIPALEADDVVCFLAAYHRTLPGHSGGAYIVCSPDKDLDQIPGAHYDYSAKNRQYRVSEEDANLHLWLQMLQGDETDNVAGIPGVGPDKAKKLLAGVEYIRRRSVVEAAYVKYFGGHYGHLIFAETYDCIRLLDGEHPMTDQYRPELRQACLTQYRQYTPVIRAPTSAAGVFQDLFG
jgi:hypothetical protein